MYASTAQVGLVHGSGFEFIDGAQAISQGSRLNAEKAAELLVAGNVEQVICSGKGPVPGQTYRSTEAQLMADHLVGLGINHNLIEIEDSSTSAMGNWVNSAPIIQALGAEEVLGITGKPNIPRMYMIGTFVATRCDFEVAGYIASAAKGRLKDYARELVVRSMTKRFLAAGQETSLDLLNEAYEAYKARVGLATVKRLVHRQRD